MDAYDIPTGVSIQIQFNKALTEKMPHSCGVHINPN